MTLKEACIIGRGCDLDTVGEAFFNIQLHAPSIFSYDELNQELEELSEDYNRNYDLGLVRKGTLISNFLEK